VVLAGVLWREPVGWRRWLALSLALCGVVVAVTRGGALISGFRPAPGHFAALAAAVTWALYSVLNRRFAQVPSAAMIGNCAAVAVLALLIHLLFEVTVMPDGPQWTALVVMGLGPTGAAFLLWDHGTKQGDLALLGLLSNAAPVLSTLGLLLLDTHSAHASQAVALGLVTAGILLGRQRSHAQRPFPDVHHRRRVVGARRRE
jgi:drug/metabolite transporter (DMT)-like permease